MKKRLDNNSGMTLVELLVAMVIVAVSIVGLYYMFNQGYTLIIEQRQRRLAFEKANEHLVAVQVNYYNSGTFNVGTDTYQEYLLDPDPENEIEGVLATITVVKEYSYLLPRITVTASWEALSGRTYEVTLAQLLRERMSS